jgi:hypothetical protein
MIRLKSASIDNISVIDSKFQSKVRQRFVELYNEITGSRIATDFRITLVSTRSKIFLSLEIGRQNSRNPFLNRITEDEFKNKISEEDFKNMIEYEEKSNIFQGILDQLMGELPALYDDSKER